MAPLAVVLVQLLTKHLLIIERDLLQLQINLLVGLIVCGGGKLVESGADSERDIRCELSAGVCDSARRIEGDACGSAELDRGSGYTLSLLVIYLYNYWLWQMHSGCCDLLPAARFNNCCTERGCFGH